MMGRPDMTQNTQKIAVTVGDVEYAYAYKSIDVTKITLLMGTQKQADAIEYCASLLSTPIPDTQENADLRAIVSQEVFNDISARVAAIKKSQAASAQANQ